MELLWPATCSMRHAGPPPVDLGQRGVVLRCLEALTGDGQLLVSQIAAQ
jgi:hypothetical protein